jgi:hypothetical protein
MFRTDIQINYLKYLEIEEKKQIEEIERDSRKKIFSTVILFLYFQSD